MLSSNAGFAFSQQRCCIPFLVQIFELRRHYLISKNALHFYQPQAVSNFAVGSSSFFFLQETFAF